MRLPYFFILVLILVSPVCALTVSSSSLKWNEVNVIGTVTHDILITNNPAISTVAFSENLQGICEASPDTLSGNGDVVLSCTPSASVTGYARIAEVSESTVQTGIRIPITLSTTDKPITEVPTVTATLPEMKAPVQEIPVPAGEPEYKPEFPGMLYMVIGAGCLLVLFAVVVIFDSRRGKKVKK